jgi:hypothetical protein
MDKTQYISPELLAMIQGKGGLPGVPGLVAGGNPKLVFPW